MPVFMVIVKEHPGRTASAADVSRIIDESLNTMSDGSGQVSNPHFDTKAIPVPRLELVGGKAACTAVMDSAPDGPPEPLVNLAKTLDTAFMDTRDEEQSV